MSLLYDTICTVENKNERLTQLSEDGGNFTFDDDVDHQIN
jgi:hypothetical protein